MAVGLTYQHPPQVAGGTTAPASQWGGNMVTAALAMGDTDTTATFGHGFALSTSELAALFPVITVTQISSNGASSVGLSFSAQGANGFTITKPNLAGSGGAWNVYVARPMSTNK